MGKEIISKDLLDILACPVCKKDVKLIEYKKNEHGLRCAFCQKIYPVRDGIPVMLVDESIKSS